MATGVVAIVFFTAIQGLTAPNSSALLLRLQVVTEGNDVALPAKSSETKTSITSATYLPVQDEVENTRYHLGTSTCSMTADADEGFWLHRF